jgi:hypothetical protein
MLARHANNPSSMIDDLYLQALSRLPTGEEKKLIAEVLTETPDVAVVQDLLWSVLLLPEFQLIR